MVLSHDAHSVARITFETVDNPDSAHFTVPKTISRPDNKRQTATCWHTQCRSDNSSRTMIRMRMHTGSMSNPLSQRTAPKSEDKSAQRVDPSNVHPKGFWQAVLRYFRQRFSLEVQPCSPAWEFTFRQYYVLKTEIPSFSRPIPPFIPDYDPLYQYHMSAFHCPSHHQYLDNGASSPWFAEVRLYFNNIDIFSQSHFQWRGSRACVVQTSVDRKGVSVSEEEEEEEGTHAQVGDMVSLHGV